MNAKAHDTMVETLGIVLTDVGDDYLKGTMPVTARNCQPMRILHGGASVAFAESLASIAANWSLNDEQAAVGQEINANHLRPAREGETVTGITRLVHAAHAVRSGRSISATSRGSPFAFLASLSPSLSDAHERAPAHP